MEAYLDNSATTSCSKAATEKMVELLGEPESAGVPDVSNVSLYENATGEEWMQVYKMGENTLVFYYLSGEYVGTLLYSTNSFTLIGE